MRRAVVLVLAAGCRQIFGLDPVVVDDGGADAAGDGADAASSACVGRWLAGPKLATPMPVTGLYSTRYDTHPFVTRDGSTLYYVVDNDIYEAAYDSMGNFNNVALVESLSSTSSEGRAYVNLDQTRAFFSSNRPGGGGGHDLWRGARSSLMTGWSVDQQFLEKLNGAGDQTNPFLSHDLLHIYFGEKGKGIMFSQRTSTGASFATATSLGLLPAQAGDDDMPTLTDDERLIVFASMRSGTMQLWYATRDSASATFRPPQQIPDVVAPQSQDEAPYLTPDGCQLYFASDRSGSYDVYVAAVL